VEGYEDVAALGEGGPPQTPPVCQGRTPETRMGCAGGGSSHVLREFVFMNHA
jgi:hypothetical protein